MTYARSAEVQAVRLRLHLVGDDDADGDGQRDECGRQHDRRRADLTAISIIFANCTSLGFVHRISFWYHQKQG